MLAASLRLTEIFTSIQGETSFSGLPTTFVRLSSCNLRCSWCDTPYSFSRGSEWQLADIVKECEAAGAKHVCITGGEPLLQTSVFPLMKALCDLDFTVSLETGGSLPIRDVDPRVHIIFDIKCPGSAMADRMHWDSLPLLETKDQVKFVVKNRQDYDYARRLIQKHSLHTQVSDVLLSPVFGEQDSRELAEWILQDRLPVRLNLQIHKYIWEPSTQGV